MGLIDEQVISESPKSLKYRLEYWSATSDMILDHIGLPVSDYGQKVWPDGHNVEAVCHSAQA